MSAGKRFAAAIVAVALVVGVGACGDEDDPGSGTTEVATQDRPAAKAGGQGGPSGSDKAKSGSSGGSSSESGDASDDFAPRPHEDSGGGSAQFRVKGGDNSVQEFGAEADSSELDAAATVLHNFLDARAQRAWASACSYLSNNVRDSLELVARRAQRAAAEQGVGGQQEPTTCANVLRNLTPPVVLPELRREAALADVGSLRVEDGRAFVIYTGLENIVYAVPMANEGGSWKVASIGGSPLN